MALVFGDNLEDLVFNKETVQQIYNANYNFSKPPLKPTVTAVAGDKQVFLYWNSVAEDSRDPFLGFQNNDPTQGYKKDFEGYLIYRSNEPEFNDIKIITDSKGTPKFWKPIAQFDLIDQIKGPDPVGINGARFWRGNETGLQHSYVDNDVINGQKYYYAIVSYDMGDPDFGTQGLTPSECTKIISEDFTGTLKFVDINCAVMVPNAPAAGYIPPQISGDVNQVTEGIGTGDIRVNVLNAAEIKEGAAYNIIFKSDGDIPDYKSTSCFITRITGSQVDTVVSNVDTSDFGIGKFSPPFDGMTISIINDTAVTVIDSSTGWLVGTSNLLMSVTPDMSSPARNLAWPSDYEIRFYDEVKATTPFFKIPVKFLVINTTSGDTVKAEVFDNNGDKTLNIEDEIVIIEYIGTSYKITWRITYYAPGIPNVQPVQPVPGDIFVIKTREQFKEGDYFTFSTKASGVDVSRAKDDLANIGVVPNPYVAAAKWERRNLNQTGRGERRIDFINLPAECTIRIYTITGSLVKTLNKNSSPTDGTISWNLISDDGMDVAYGVYIYHVDAPDVGEHIGKFAIIK